MSRIPDPIEIRYTRGSTRESVHQVAAVIATADDIKQSWGNADAPTFPRSAFKPFQALALIESGAAEAFDLKPHQLALAMASHSGEPRHTEGVMSWLEALGLEEAALHCGQHAPMWAKATADLYREGQEPSPRHNNCSGKHTGMLTMMQHLGGEQAIGANYEDYDHPVQAHIRHVANQFVDADLTQADWARDGCAVPNYAMPLKDLALSFARLLTPPEGFEQACHSLLSAWGDRPDLVAGSERFDTAVMLATDSAVLSKGGAEGVQAALIPSKGIGLAVKALDGAQRAAEQAMASLLVAQGALDLADEPLRKHWSAADRTVRNVRGDRIGEIIVLGQDLETA